MIDLFLHGEQSGVLVILVETLDRDFQRDGTHGRVEIEDLVCADPLSHVLVVG